MPLDRADGASIESRIAAIESRTGVRVTTVVVAKSDAYDELPWKAFALGASLAALATVIDQGVGPNILTRTGALGHAFAILAVGAASALATLWLPWWARLFLRALRREVEVRQHAQSIFLTRELFDTPARSGLLILVSRLERKIYLLPDTGLRECVSTAEWRPVIARMTPLLRASHPVRALHEGLAAVEELLVRKAVSFSVAPQPVREASP